MAQLVYPGPAATVDVPSLQLEARRGVPVDVPDGAVKQLLAQGWTQPGPASKATKDGA